MMKTDYIILNLDWEIGIVWAGSECQMPSSSQRGTATDSRQSNLAIVTSPSYTILGRKAKLYSEEMNLM